MFYKNGLNFECQRCSSCCRLTPGVVFFTDEEATNISNYLNIEKKVFYEKYCRTLFFNGESKLALLEKPNYDCIFWDKKCLIYPVRPIQCSTYPFWPHILESKESWDNEMKECPGINKGKLNSFDEISSSVELFKKR